MTFESMIDNVTEEKTTTNAANPIPNAADANAIPLTIVFDDEALAVKVSYGDDIRRATFAANKSYVALRDLCAQLFELDPTTTVLKYQDEDGDKITLSSDGELSDALRFTQEKKTLRLFVEPKAPAASVEDVKLENENAFPCWRGRSFPMRGGFHGRGGHHGFPHGGPGFHHPPHHGFPHGGPGFHHPPHHAFPHPHPNGPFDFPHPHPEHHGFPHPHPTGPFAHHFVHNMNSPHAAHSGATTTELPQQPASAGGPSAQYRSHKLTGQGVYSPASAAGASAFPHHPRGGPYARGGFKERKHEMKQHIKQMKMNATTEEDRQTIKLIKQQMKAECKEKWHGMKADKASWKAEKKAQKQAWRDEKKAQKADWRDDKECEKNDRLVARHVADVTIPDNSELPADTPVTKTWLLRNAGLMAWPIDSQLIFVSRRGDNLNGPERVLVGAVEPNQEVEVSVTFITPAEPGRYIGYYRMATPEGTKFGQRVWVSFIIPAPAPHADPAYPELPAVPTAPLVDATLVPASPSAPTVSLAKSPAPDAADDVTME